eukprot:gnl/TRDRNA2_/TRDRNA2_183558_c0_seq1.p1 gnl/TRDRNA2_/TRDRNA2_183558_c0~~gnl/TRDRNA2_/TRDRNA2_183558_c0_seq1.p1  ORF type:complete len:253 (-),score=60.19 gnl/TRDRNA2_/TRDRNA2_183558_c0_seq1:120-878(-)
MAQRRYLDKQQSGDLDGGQPSEAAPEGSNVVLKKKLFDQNVSDWSARYRKNKSNLEGLCKDCDLLRNEVSKLQQDVDERTDHHKLLENRFEDECMVKFQEMKQTYEVALQQKGMLQVQIAENRKRKNNLTREKKMLGSDYERKHAELMRTCEVRDKLESQLAHLTQQLGQLTNDRRRMERELDEVQHNLRTNNELADEYRSEIHHVQHGIKDSMEYHMSGTSRLETSTTQSSTPRNPQDGYMPVGSPGANSR